MDKTKNIAPCVQPKIVLTKNHDPYANITHDICESYYFGRISEPAKMIQNKFKTNGVFFTKEKSQQIFDEAMVNYLHHHISQEADQLIKLSTNNKNGVKTDNAILLFLAQMHFISPNYKTQILEFQIEDNSVKIKYNILTKNKNSKKSITIPLTPQMTAQFQCQYEIFQYKKFGTKVRSAEAIKQTQKYVHSSVLVLSGGGAKGILHGALLNAVNNSALEKIYGNSAGALVATLVAAGATEEETIKMIPEILFEPPNYHVQDYKKHQEKEKIKLVLALAIKKIICSRIKEAEQATPDLQQKAKLQELLNTYNNRDFNTAPITFAELKKLRETSSTFKELFVNGFIPNTSTEILFSHKNTPNVSIISAALASASIPPIFSAEKFSEKDLNIGDKSDKLIEVIDGGLVNKLLISHAVSGLAPEQTTDSIVVSYLEKNSDIKSTRNKYKKTLLKSIIEWIFGAKLFFAHNSTDYHMISQYKYFKIVVLNAEKIADVSTTSFQKAKDTHNKLLMEGYKQSIEQLYCKTELNQAPIKAIKAETYQKKRMARIAFRVFFNKKAKTISKKNLGKKLCNILSKDQIDELKSWLLKHYSLPRATINKIVEKATLLQLIMICAEKHYSTLSEAYENNILDQMSFKMYELEQRVNKFMKPQTTVPAHYRHG